MLAKFEFNFLINMLMRLKILENDTLNKILMAIVFKNQGLKVIFLKEICKVKDLKLRVYFVN